MQTATITAQTSDTQSANCNVLPADQYVPPSLWAHDHWSTLAYVESVITECAGYQLGQDARMRAHRRNFRAMQECKSPKRAGNRLGEFALVSVAPTRLKNGFQVAVGHDDYSCVQDLAHEGLFELDADNVEPGVTMHLSEKGRAWVNALRAFKQGGGMFEDFDLSMVPQIESTPKRAEYFELLGMRFHISAILNDIEKKRLKVKMAVLGREFIELFATKMAGLCKDLPDSENCSALTGVVAREANALHDSVLNQPVMLGYVGKNKGTLSIDDTGAHYMLIDGNKRMGKAFFADRATVPVYVLTQAQTRKYRVS